MTFEKYIEGMSLRDMVTHILCPAIRAKYRENSDPREYFDVIFKDKSIKPGTIFFFPSEKEDIIKLTVKMTEFLGSQPLIAMDMETSPSCISGTTTFGDGMSISAANSVEDAYLCGKACANEGRECGVNWTYGPVVDLSVNPYSPGNNTRSWGDDPERVIKFTKAFTDGITDNGVIATPKHFPGSGCSNVDEHLRTSVCEYTKEQWFATYGKVWKAHIDNGARSIMTGHIALPAFEENGEIIPATLSKNVTTGLLRNQLGFDGLIVTDAINMGGLLPHVKDVEDCVVKLINAGNDVILFPNFFADMSEIADALENAVKTGKITIERIKESIYRIWREKEFLGITDNKVPVLPACDNRNREEYAETAKRIAENSISLYKNEINLLPLDSKKIKKVISVDVTNFERHVNNKLDAVLEQNGIEIFKYGDYTDNGFVSILDLPKADAIIVNFYYGFVWGSNHITPCGRKLQKVYEYLYNLPIPVIMVCHGSPFISTVFPYVKTVINTFSVKDIAPETLYDIIFGNKEAKGITPVKI